MVQVGWQSAVHSHRLSRKFVSSIQKHVLTVCATSGGDIYYWSHSFLQEHDTILLTGSICTPSKSKTYFAQMKAQKKRSYAPIVNKILLRVAHWHCQKTRLELSLVIQLKNKRLLYGSYKCATTDKKISWLQHTTIVLFMCFFYSITI